MKIFLMGGTGLVGSRLVRRLLDRKDQVVLLTRRPEVARQKWGDACTVVEGNPMQAGPWMTAVDDCDAVVNLVGEGIFNRRWRAKFKQLLRDSRVQSTEHIVQVLARQPAHGSRRREGAGQRFCHRLVRPARRRDPRRERRGRQ